MRSYSKIGGREGRPAYRTPAFFVMMLLEKAKIKGILKNKKKFLKLNYFNNKKYINKDMTELYEKKFSPEKAQSVAEELGINWDEVDFDLKQFADGMNVELEHGSRDMQTDVTNDDPIMTGKIALAHLKEFGDYYIRLEKMEKEAEGKI